MNEKGNSSVSVLFGLSALGWLVAAWFTHVVICIKAGTWGFLIAGAIMAPLRLFMGREHGSELGKK